MKTNKRGSLPIFLTLLAWAILVQAGATLAQPDKRLIHVFVALADNASQGIVPVPPALGNGEDPSRNLYWGAMYGIRTYFRKSPEWKEASSTAIPNTPVLERAVFVHRASGVRMVADAYRGAEIKQALNDFFRAAAGHDPKIEGVEGTVALAAYIGHDVLMEVLPLAEFTFKSRFQSAGTGERDAIMLACKSKFFFGPFLRPGGARPLLWTTQLMAPEAYTLKAALDGWIARETPERIRDRAASAYAKHQKISLQAARGLLVTGW